MYVVDIVRVRAGYIIMRGAMVHDASPFRLECTRNGKCGNDTKEKPIDMDDI